MSRLGAIRSHLNLSLTIDVGGRITPPPLDPKTVYPAITLQEIAGKELENIEGRSGLVRTRFQINCWHKDYELAWNLREAVKSSMQSIGVYGSALVMSTNHAGDREFYDAKLEAHQSIVDFFIWWQSAEIE